MIRAQLDTLKQDSYDISKKESKPGKLDSAGSFLDNGYSSFKFILSEKENLLFAFLQYAVIGLGYFIWVEALDWIPKEVWESSNESDGNHIANVLLLLWSFVCVGLVAYPLGILTACMGASYLLRFEGRQSTIIECFKIVLQKSWTLWIFSWLDGWWTVLRILERLPKKNDRTPRSVKIFNEAVYQAWKIASLGFLPATLSGRGIADAGKDSLSLVKSRFKSLAKLRIGYSFICWIFGVGCYIGMLFIFPFLDIHRVSDNDIYNFYFFAGFPILMALMSIMLFFRPIYIISACRIYAYYAREHNIEIKLPESSSRGISTFVTFVVLAIITGVILLYHNELGISELLDN